MNEKTFNMAKRTLANYCPYRYAASYFLNQLVWRLFCINSTSAQCRCLWRISIRVQYGCIIADGFMKVIRWAFAYHI